jgi:hypothetical protein
MKAQIITKELKRLIKATSKFISKNEHRPMLQYIRLDFNKENCSVKAVSLDGYRMAIETAECAYVECDFSAYIKPYLPVGANSDYSIIEVEGGRCLIDIDGRIVGCQQPVGTFMDDAATVKTIESIPVTHEVAVSKAFILDALNSLQPDEFARDPITIQIRDTYGAITLRTKNGVRYVLPIRK